MLESLDYRRIKCCLNIIEFWPKHSNDQQVSLSVCGNIFLSHTYKTSLSGLSLHTIVLNSRDRPKKQWRPQFMHL